MDGERWRPNPFSPSPYQMEEMKEALDNWKATPESYPSLRMG